MEEVVLVANDQDAALHCIDLSTGAQLFCCRDNRSSSGCVSLVTTGASVSMEGSGNYICASQADKAAIQIWTLEKENVHLKCAMTEKMRALRPLLSGSFLLGGSASGKLYLWETSTGQLLRVWNAHYKAVSVIQTTDDGMLALTGGEDGIVNVWSVGDIVDFRALNNEGSVGITPVSVWTDHSLSITSIHCGYGGPNARIFTSSLDGSCKIWDLAMDRMIYSVVCPVPVKACTVDSEESQLFLGGSNGVIYEVDLNASATAAFAVAARIRGGESHSLGALAGKVEDESSSKASFVGHQQGIVGLAVTMNGSSLVSASEDGSLRLWDIMSRQCLRKISVSKGPLSTLLMLPRNLVAYRHETSKPLIPIQPLKKFKSTSAVSNEEGKRDVLEGALFSIGGACR